MGLKVVKLRADHLCEGSEYDQPKDATASWDVWAARAVMHDLCGRRGFDHILEDVDIIDRREIIATLASIIRETHDYRS